MVGIVVEVFLRSALLLLAAIALCRIPRFLSSAQRHLLMAAAFAILALWPAMAFWIPEWQISLPILGHVSRDGTVTIQQFFSARNGAGSWPTFAQMVVAIWLAGFVIMLLPVLCGFVRVRKLIGSSVFLCSEGSPKISELTEAPVLIHSSLTVPMACGIVERRILLPANCRTWPESMWRAVLIHENAHLLRHDIPIQVAARIVAAMWWFQPLAWYGLYTLRSESERACDEVVLRRGMRPSEYAAALLEIARQLTAGPRRIASASGFISEADVRRRIGRLLVSSPVPAEWRKAVAATLLLLLSAVTVTAVTVVTSRSDQLHFTQSTGGSTVMKRALFITLAGLSAQTFQNATAAPTPAAGSPQTNNAPSHVRVKPEVLQANLIHKVDPVYPASAKSAGIQGRVVLDVTVSKDGIPEDLKVVSSPSDDLTQSATDAVREWRYRSTLLNGQPIEVVGQVFVSYTLAP